MSQSRAGDAGYVTQLGDYRSFQFHINMGRQQVLNEFVFTPVVASNVQLRIEISDDAAHYESLASVSASGTDDVSVTDFSDTPPQGQFLRLTFDQLEVDEWGFTWDIMACPVGS